MDRPAASGRQEQPDHTPRGRRARAHSLQTAGALVGALFAIILAIAGVTLTFRAHAQ
jgi:hypothetical protein